MEARQSLSRRNSHASQLDTQAQVPGFSDGANVRNLNFYKGLFLARVPCALCRTVQPSHCQRAAKCADRARKEPTPATARGRKVGVEGGARARNTGSPLEPAFPPIDSRLQHPPFSRCPRPPTPPPPARCPCPRSPQRPRPHLMEVKRAPTSRSGRAGGLGPMSAGHLLVLLDDPIRETRTRYSPRSTFCNQPVLPSFARETWALRTEVFVHSGLGRRLSMHSVAPVATP
jgi:hypothetical protein